MLFDVVLAQLERDVIADILIVRKLSDVFVAWHWYIHTTGNDTEHCHHFALYKT